MSKSRKMPPIGEDLISFIGREQSYNILFTMDNLLLNHPCIDNFDYKDREHMALVLRMLLDNLRQTPKLKCEMQLFG